MSRSGYIVLATILFAIAYIPSLISTILGEPILIYNIPKNKIKFFLIILACFMESSLIKKQYPGIIGWLVSTCLTISLLGLVIHFQGAKEGAILSTIIILGLLIFYAIKEKNKNIFNYLIFTFIALRVLIILLPRVFPKWYASDYYEFFWWADLTLGSIITVFGIKYSYRLITQK